MLKRLIFSLLFFIPIHLFAQNNTLTGNVFDNEYRSTRLEGATIKNINNKAVAIADKDGHFAISAKIGDLVSFGMVGYQTDTVYLINLFPKNVFLIPQVNNLKTVDITSTKISPYLDLKDPDAVASKELNYGKERGGLRLALGYGKYRRQQAKIIELEENDKYQEEINKYFNAEVIKKLVKFEGDEINDYIGLYRPTINQIKEERPFNYTYYIARTYQIWIKLPADQRKLPPLPKLKAN